MLRGFSVCQIYKYAMDINKYCCELLQENSRLARKWQQKLQPQAEEAEVSRTTLNIRIHSITYSQAQIIIPRRYFELYKLNQILKVQCGKKCLLAQVTHQSIPQEETNDDSISVLNILVDLYALQSNGGILRGEIHLLTTLDDHRLSIVQFLVKESYFSRRDQYKVHKLLDSQTHVYSKKTLYIEELSLQVVNMLKNNSQICKTGIIDKNTKIIFRSNCSKSTLAIQISVESFTLDAQGQIYIEKILDFLEVYFIRNNHFNNKHRINIILFARLFYPKFSSLQGIYAQMKNQKDLLQETEQYLKTDLTTAFQKDYNGRIYQDVYRQITFPTQQLRMHFWAKISELIYSINWDTTERGKFIAASVLTLKNTIPHKMLLKCHLASSSQSNLLQMISIVGEEYKQHYRLRSLNETGNAILVLSAGNAMYQCDYTTFTIAQSYVNLTNISCTMINVNVGTNSKLTFKIVHEQELALFEKPTAQTGIYGKKNRFSKKNIASQNECPQQPTIQSFKHLKIHCLEALLQNGWIRSHQHNYPEKFQSKSKVFNHQLYRVEQRELCLHCNCNYHYYVTQDTPFYQFISHKEVDFIKLIYMDQTAFKNHQLFYQGHFQLSLKLKMKKRPNLQKTQLQIFSSDLDKILHRKTDLFCLDNLSNLVDLEIESFLKTLKDKNETNSLEIKDTILALQCNYSKAKTVKNISSVSIFQNKEQKKLIFRKSEHQKYNKYDKYNRQDRQDKCETFEKYFRPGSPSISQSKICTFYQQKLKYNYIESPIHYMNSTFTQAVVMKFRNYVNGKDCEQRYCHAFEIQKRWKNVCFPLLIPIFTQYRPHYHDLQEHVMGTEVGNFQIVEQEVCKLLMKNYQIHEIVKPRMDGKKIELYKGLVICQLSLNGHNISRMYLIDKLNQELFIPFLHYKFLCYEDKNKKMESRTLFLQDKNFYDKKRAEELQNKSVKLSLVQNGQQFKCIQKFVFMFNEKYKDYPIKVVQSEKREKSEKQCRMIKLNKQSEEIQFEIDLQSHWEMLFAIQVKWNYCSAVLVKEFVDNICTMSRRSGLVPFFTMNSNLFTIPWSIATFAQMHFSTLTAVHLFENKIIRSRGWKWDSQEYYMDIEGMAFLKIISSQRVALWRNNYEPKNKPQEECNLKFKTYFIEAAMIDFIATAIERALRK